MVVVEELETVVVELFGEEAFDEEFVKHILDVEEGLVWAHYPNFEGS